MTMLIDNLCELAIRQNPGRVPTWSDVDREVRPGLVHVIRRILRTGGQSLVARWVVGTLGIEPGSPRAADSDPNELASMLCKEIVCHLQSKPRLWSAPRAQMEAETVVEERRYDRLCRA